MQMYGMLLGGILWGILGDKKGRLSVLFGSIFMYSVANIANGMVHSVEAYAFWRFIAGIGLAGELGAGITLVAESLPKNKRGYGTMIVASVGLTGAIVANLVYQIFEDWRLCYYACLLYTSRRRVDSMCFSKKCMVILLRIYMHGRASRFSTLQV